MIDPAPVEPPTVIPLLPDSPVVAEPGGSGSSPSPEKPADENLVAGPVYLDSADLLVLESYPLQYRLLLKGSLPDPCHELKVVVPAPDAQGVIDVQVFSLADPGKVCIQVLEPFETSVSLDGFPPGTFAVMVNGEPVGQIEVAAPQTGLSMKGYELYAWQSRRPLVVLAAFGYQPREIPGGGHRSSPDAAGSGGLEEKARGASRRRVRCLVATTLPGMYLTSLRWKWWRKLVNSAYHAD